MEAAHDGVDRSSMEKKDEGPEEGREEGREELNKEKEWPLPARLTAKYGGRGEGKEGGAGAMRLHLLNFHTPTLFACFFPSLPFLPLSPPPSLLLFFLLQMVSLLPSPAQARSFLLHARPPSLPPFRPRSRLSRGVWGGGEGRKEGGRKWGRAAMDTVRGGDVGAEGGREEGRKGERGRRGNDRLRFT